MNSSVSESSEPNPASRFAVLAACLLILVALIDSQVVGAITPQIAFGLHAAKPTVAASVTGYSLAAAAVALGLGRYSRRIRPGTWLPIAALIFSAASLLSAFAPHVAIFFLARSLAGLAGGLISALAIAALANASSYAKRGKQMSGVAVSYFLAPVLGVPLGTYLTGLYSWRVVFGVSAVLVALAGLLVRLFPLPDSGATTPAADLTPPSNTSPFKTLWEMATRTRSTAVGIISAFFVSGGLVGFTTYLGTWLSDAFHTTSNQVGLIYATAGLGAVVGGAIGGLLADRFGKQQVAVRSSLGMVVLLLIVPTFHWSTTLFILIGLAAFLASLRVAPLQALITELVKPEERAAYVALRNGSSQLGIATAAVVGAELYKGFGFVGVGLFCAGLTLLAWQSIQWVHDPHATLDHRPQELTFRYRMMRAGIRVTLMLAFFIFLIVPFLLSLFITKPPTRPDERNRTDTPAAYGASFENVTFTASDQNQVSGWYLPNPAASTTFIIAHGQFRSRYEGLKRGIDFWNAGNHVLLFDMRHHGQSRAEFSSIGFYERRDILAAIDYVRTRTPQTQIVLMGISMGAASTLMAAAEAKNIRAVIAESSFLSLRDAVYHHVSMMNLPTFPFAPILLWITAWRLGFAPDDYDVRAAVGQITCPILFIGSGNDTRMPNDTVLEPLFTAARNPLKQKFIVAGARHGHAYDVAPREYQKIVAQFLRSISM